MDHELFVTPGLGDNSYLLVSGGKAVVVDPQRGASRFLSAADARKLRVRDVLETHVHDDYVGSASSATRTAGSSVRSYPTAGVDDLCHAYLGGPPVQALDVRQSVEWDTGHVPGSRHIHLGDLPGRVGGSARPTVHHRHHEPIHEETTRGSEETDGVRVHSQARATPGRRAVWRRLGTSRPQQA